MFRWSCQVIVIPYSDEFCTIFKCEFQTIIRFLSDLCVCLVVSKVKLESLDSEFRTQHFALIDLLGEADDLSREQDTLDEHNDCVASLTTHIQCLISSLSPSSPSTTPVLTDSQGITSAWSRSIHGERHIVCWSFRRVYKRQLEEEKPI